MIPLPDGIVTGVLADEARELERLATGRSVIEFGAWLGFSTVLMGRVARQMVSVDWHHGDEHAGERDTLPTYIANLERFELRDRIITIVGRFEEVTPLLRQDSFEMGFLDGMHDRRSVLRDLDLLDSLLMAHAVLAVHDYDRWLGEVRFEVSDAIWEWLPRHPDWRVDHVVNSLCVLSR